MVSWIRERPLQCDEPQVPVWLPPDWQTSFAGEDDRADANIAAFQPFGFYQLGKGWYLRSAGIWTYNFENDDYAIPIGVGKVTKLNKAVMKTFIEPQRTVAHEGDGQPD